MEGGKSGGGEPRCHGGARDQVEVESRRWKAAGVVTGRQGVTVEQEADFQHLTASTSTLEGRGGEAGHGTKTFLIWFTHPEEDIKQAA